MGAEETQMERASQRSAGEAESGTSGGEESWDEGDHPHPEELWDEAVDQSSGRTYYYNKVRSGRAARASCSHPARPSSSSMRL